MTFDEEYKAQWDDLKKRQLKALLPFDIVDNFSVLGYLQIGTVPQLLDDIKPLQIPVPFRTFLRRSFDDNGWRC